jgi:hypothetical protein
MTNKELKPWDLKEVIVTLSDGSRHTGTFDVAPAEGLYHVTPTPSRSGVIERSGPLVDLYVEDTIKIEPA